MIIPIQKDDFRQRTDLTRLYIFWCWFGVAKQEDGVTLLQIH